MSLEKNKKKISHSIIKQEIASLKNQTIHTCWETKKISNIVSDISIIQKFLKTEVNPTINLNKIAFIKCLSKTTFIDKFVIQKEKNAISSFENIKLSNKILGTTKISSFNDNLEISDFLNKSKKSKLTKFLFTQLKQFFLKMPEDNLKTWTTKNKDIFNIIHTTNVTSLNLFLLNSKLKSK